MSGYTIGEITGWLVLTGLLGFVLGWLAHGLAVHAGPAHDPADDAGAGDEVAQEPPVVPESTPEPAPEPPTADTEVAAPEVPDPPAGFTPGPVEGSALPLEGGASPGPEWTVKANLRSKVFHDAASPFYLRTTAQVWFRDAEDAIAAGFRAPRR